MFSAGAECVATSLALGIRLRWQCPATARGRMPRGKVERSLAVVPIVSTGMARARLDPMAEQRWESAGMMNGTLQDTIKCAMETGELSSLHDHFSDDVELKIGMTAEPVPSVARCSLSVIDRLQDFGKVALAQEHQVPEVIANGERVVAFWDEWVSLRSGVAIRVQCTLVFDVREALITRLAIHHDISPVRTRRRAARGRSDGPIAGSVASHVLGDRAVPRAG